METAAEWKRHRQWSNLRKIYFSLEKRCTVIFDHACIFVEINANRHHWKKSTYLNKKPQISYCNTNLHNYIRMYTIKRNNVQFVVRFHSIIVYPPLSIYWQGFWIFLLLIYGNPACVHLESVKSFVKVLLRFREFPRLLSPLVSMKHSAARIITICPCEAPYGPFPS